MPTFFSDFVLLTNYTVRPVDMRKNHERLNGTFRHPSRRYEQEETIRVPRDAEMRIAYDGMKVAL